MNRWGQLFALAREHHGVITLSMAAEVGLSATAVRARAAAEGWVRLARGVWLMPGAAATAQAVASAHLSLLGERAAISHWSAAHLHGLAREAPSEVHLIVPFDRRPEGQPGSRVHRSRTLIAGDVIEVEGLRTTSIPRTLRDLAPTRSWDELYDLVTEAEQKGQADLAALVAMMNRLHHGPGSGRFRDVIEQRRADRSDSALERDTRDAARVSGFSPSAGPFPIRTRGGALLRLDVAFPVAWFAIECDGYGFHRDRRAFERDRERWRLAQQTGWRLTWVTRRRLRHDLDGLIEEIAEAHRTADPSRPPAVAAA